MSLQEATVAKLYRTEVEVAANAVIAMFRAGLLRDGVTVGQMASAVGVPVEEMRLASVRSERMTAERLRPAEEPTRSGAAVIPLHPDHEPVRPSLPSKVYERDHAPKRGDTRPPEITRTLPRARKVCAEAIFAMWRARGNLICTRCGKPIDSGCDAVIEAAHHADACTP